MLPVRERAAPATGGGGGRGPPSPAAGLETRGVDMRSITSSACLSTVLDV